VGGELEVARARTLLAKKKGIKIRPEKVWWGSPKATENQTISLWKSGRTIYCIL